MIHITAADRGNCSVFRGKLLADLQIFFFIHKSDTLPYDIVTIKDSIESFRGKINGFWKRRKVGFKKNVLDKAFFVMYTLKVKIIETQIN